MSNKTSDKNVENVEELIKEYKTYNDLDGIQDLQPYIRALQNILADYTRQKQINEEHRKLNGELRERVKELERNSNCDSVYAIKFATMQQQINEKDKRIQELEEENKKKSIELICYQEELDNSIPEQAIKDKIEKLKNDYDQKYDLYMGYKVESREQQDILKQMSILQELLETK